jgi:hypothetical protein
MGAAVIRVRRRDFVSGSHNVTGFQGIAERLPRGVTIYLLPGLTGRQRRAVIRRLRQEASRGCGPELPLPQLVMALLLDRVRGALGLAVAALRLHPGTTLLPAALVGVVLTLFVLASGGVGPVPAARPALAAAQSTTGPATVASTTGSAPTAAAGVGAGGLVAIDGGSKSAPAGSAGAGGIRPSSVGAGGRGLGSGQQAPTAGPRSAGRPRAARVCFGAMPGVVATHSPLACHRTSS